MNSPLAGLMNPAQIGADVQNAFESGREQMKQIKAESALSAYAANPNDEAAFQQVAKYAPRYAMQIGADRQKAQKEQEAAKASQLNAQREQLAKVADLLDNSTDEASYQRNLAAARQLNMDVSTAPPNFDPEFIQTQSVIARAVLNNDPELPLIAQEAVAAGLKPGTPEFQSEVGRILKAKYSTSKTVSYQPGGGAVAYDEASGQITPLIEPGSAEQPDSGIPPQAVADLRKNPALAAQFDEIFGPGAAKRALGGGVSNGTNGF